MKPKVKFHIENCETEEMFSIDFYDVETIDSLIDSLEVARAELEHKIEMKKLRKREKKQRAKMRKTQNQCDFKCEFERIMKEFEAFDKLSIEEKTKDILKNYEKLGESEKTILKPLIECVKSLSNSKYLGVLADLR